MTRRRTSTACDRFDYEIISTGSDGKVTRRRKSGPASRRRRTLDLLGRLGYFDRPGYVRRRY